MALSQILNFDYGFFGVALIFLFYLFKNSKLFMNISYILLVFVHYAISFMQYPSYQYLLLCAFTLISIVFINFYNGKKGKDSKYFLYFFYPSHLIFLYILSYLI